MMRSCEAIARDLPPKEWARQRFAFYRFTEEHVLTHQRLFELNDNFPRLLGLAVSCMDWLWVLRLLRRTVRIVNELQEEVRHEDPSGILWKSYRSHLGKSLYEAIAQTLRPGASPPTKRLADRLVMTFSRLTPQAEWPNRIETAVEKGALLFFADLGRTPYKEAIIEGIPAADSRRPLQLSDIEEQLFSQVTAVFEHKAIDKATARAIILPTRPLNATEVMYCDQSCVNNADHWAACVRALRGNFTRAAEVLPAPQRATTKTCTVIGTSVLDRRPRLAVTSVLVEDKSWALAADGKEDWSDGRYSRLMRLANEVITCNPRPQYVIFPELSIPQSLVRSLGDHFTRSGISMIAGAEYERTGRFVRNEAVLYLCDDRLGYPAPSCIRQQKVLPALHEQQTLRKHFGVSFPPDPPEQKRIYDHFGFCFGLLLCSEVTDIKKRASMRGNVDAQIVLSWNKDLNSFASLAESAALDIHCFLVIVNNRRFGDSRVRAPYDETWKRDIVRVKGGLADFFVVCDLDVRSLRDFQSHVESPDKPFKPVPEGFAISPNRRATPGASDS